MDVFTPRHLRYMGQESSYRRWFQRQPFKLMITFRPPILIGKGCSYKKSCNDKYTPLFKNGNMRTLKLFNAVISRPSTESPFISDEGFIILPDALWAKEQIQRYYLSEKLNGNSLNKTFHKSWTKIKNTPRFELLIDQILHYISTYGSDFKDEVYIPHEILNIPDVELVYKTIRGYTKDEIRDKCLSLLQSGMALKEETINDILSVLVEDVGYSFTGNEKIKNKEAVVKIADIYGVLPKDTMEFFRYIIYRTTGQSLLIKSGGLIKSIKDSNYNPTVQFNKFGLDKMAVIFNRFKPLFLAFKPKCGKTINKIAKLSKNLHKPLVGNPLNIVTSRLLTQTEKHWLDNATPYAIFKALSACYTRINGQGKFVYRVRNGKSWIAETDSSKEVVESNFVFILDYLKQRYSLSEKTFFLPKDIKFGLPTSEKMYVGNIPTGTRFYGKKMAVGVYWENKWGANDIDLSGLNERGKVGWNSYYSQEGELMYSGDITSAPNGAVEYLYANKGLREDTLVQTNVFNGNDTCGYKIIVGRGDKVSKDYMMNPNNLFAEVKCNSVQKQTILGIFTPKKVEQCFVLLNFGAGHVRVAGNNKWSVLAREALLQQWRKPYSFNKLIEVLGGVIVDDRENADYDFSLDKLEKDSFIRVFDNKK